ncbi:hypothetical protein [Mycolicibacterium llatzerense]|uniref:hypothetical protein n=1 Tax=Mycolicibacterium llatzerense TaxID=280871 RepID=UPI0021B51D03|nr:hypothetical protein [Mycolicibacterium llatzerense]MCT7373004.1 hypothetical protein [Mycolicibacterium llatzerense]
MTAATPMVLQLLFTRGVPRPLAGLEAGSCAAVSDDQTITVYDSQPSPDWSLTARARWSESIDLDAQPWVALAPHSHGVILLNMRTCNISALPEPVRMSLQMQHDRYSAIPLPTGTEPQFRIAVDAGALRITTPAGQTRALPIGAPFTVTAEAYRLHEQKTFAYLSPALRVVARTIDDHGPLSTSDLLHRVHPAPTNDNKKSLHVNLSRLRHHPRIQLGRDGEGRLTIAHAVGAESSL